MHPIRSTLWMIAKSILVAVISAYIINSVINLGFRTFTEDEHIHIETGQWPYHNVWETTVPSMILGVLLGLWYYLLQCRKRHIATLEPLKQLIAAVRNSC